MIVSGGFPDSSEPIARVRGRKVMPRKAVSRRDVFPRVYKRTGKSGASFCNDVRRAGKRV